MTENYEYKFPQIIKNRRLYLKESQYYFGKRFDVSHASVSDWERGVSEAPYRVIEFVLNNPISTQSQLLTELIEEVESLKHYCHENNHQRGCVACVESNKYNRVISDVIEVLKI